MDEAISFSQKNKTFYRIDDLYRLAAAYSMMEEEWEQYEYYLKKLNQYAMFSDDTMSQVTSKLFLIESLNGYKHDYAEALSMVDQLLNDPELKHHQLIEWFHLEKGKALHGLKRYEEAINYFEKVVIPDYHHHPFDLSQFYLKETYMAQCLVELGKIEEALGAAKKAVDLFDHLPDSPFKELSLETYQKILELKSVKWGKS